MMVDRAEQQQSKKTSAGMDDAALLVRKALAGYAAGHRAEYDRLCSMLEIKDGEPAERFRLVRSVCRGISDSVSLLGREHHELVDRVLQQPWAADEDCALAVKEFVRVVVSAHSFFTVPVLRVLVGLFRFDESVADADVLNGIYFRVHGILGAVLALVPSATGMLHPVLAETYPHKRLSLEHQRCFLVNLTLLAKYAPTLRDTVVELVIEKALLIDLEIQIELDELPEDDTLNLIDESDESERSQVESAYEDQVQDTHQKTAELRALVAKLDATMGFLFAFVADCHAQRDTGPAHKQSLDCLFGLVVSCFERVVLPTFRSRHVQFLAFYMCSLDPEMAERFLGMLATRIANGCLAPSDGPSLTVAAVCHFASFISRARFLDPSCVAECFNVLANQADHLLKEGVRRNDASFHALFYSVAQALFYIIAFRHAELFSGNDLARRLQIRTVLQNLIHSRLNPLRVCQRTVVEEFARITQRYEVVFCYNLIERNKSVSLPPLLETLLLADDLDSFFPYDPYRLRNSSSFVTRDIYIEWADVCQD